MVWFCANTGSDIYVSGSGGSKGGGERWIAPPPRDPKKETNGAKGKEEEKEKEEKEKEKGKRRGKAQ